MNKCCCGGKLSYSTWDMKPAIKPAIPDLQELIGDIQSSMCDLTERYTKLEEIIDRLRVEFPNDDFEEKE